jgi:hypothetical protein
MLRKIFGRRRERVRGGWRKSHSEGNFVTKGRGVWHVWARRILVGKHRGQIPLGRPRYTLEDINKRLKRNKMGQCRLVQDRYTWWAVVNLVISLRFL